MADRPSRSRLPVLLALVASACASEGYPPGGPEDKAPPVLIESSPADRAVNATPDQAITLRFDEVIDDRQLRELPRIIRVNPNDPEFDLILDEDVVTLEPKSPLLEGVTYAVTVLPGLQDRGGNASREPRTILFSVGGETPITISLVRARIVRDTIPVPEAFYNLANQETGFGYTMVADSQGSVEIEGVAHGPYMATAWEERFRPEGWQMTEEAGAQDTFTIGPGNRSHEATYRILVRDTTAPIIRRVETPDSRVVQIFFDDTLAGTAAPPPASVRLWAGEPDVGHRDVPLDSIPLEDVRARSIAFGEVRRTTLTTVEIVPAVPLERDAVYRVEVVGVENRAGARSTDAGGRTFRAEYEGPRRFRAEPLPWPSGP
ncbi:MAG: Ig-like domain-containing protein [Gemmatimonadota bacterium]